uniref:Ig-like domain-containing protein n=1 Tax=Mastacembelus armatus TaxID=205130 RepID=A0A7N8WZZ5_9TELE
TIMFFSYLFSAVFLVNILCDDPVFTPSRLVVKHGDPTSASCSICQHGCRYENPGLEKPIGDYTRNGTMFSWRVNSMTEWDISIICHYEDPKTNKQCCGTLPITVYKPPDTVSISVNHNGLMVEGRQYTLQCTVQDVAPVGNLTVTFYRRQTSLVQIRSNKTTKAPVTETFTLKISPSKDDDGAQYWCEAKLQLGPEAPQDLPVMVSQNLTATVYYIPQAVNSLSHEINVTEGDTLHLNCSAVGNPSPSYNWSGPTHHISPFNNISVLTIKSVHADSAGQYNCTVENNMGKVNVLFTVHVKGGSCPVFTFEIAMVKNGVAEKQPRYLLSVLFSPSSCKLTLAHVKLRQTFIVTVLVFGIGVMNNSLFCFLYPIPLTQLSTANNISCILVTAILFCVVIGAILLGAYAAYYKHHRMGEYNLKKILRVRSKHIPMLPA